MTVSIFSAPTLLTPTRLKSNPALTDKIIALINDAFERSKISEPKKWEGPSGKRFPTRDSYLEGLIGETGIVAVTFDDEEPVAVAAAVPWKGGWEKEGASVEQGWEIKAVAVHGDARYLHRGLAVELYAFLQQYLIKQEKARLSKNPELKAGGQSLLRHVTLWILAAECINGVYWRKRGYQEVRRKTCGKGTWGCLTSFEMVVLRKDVPFEMDSTRHGSSREP